MPSGPQETLELNSTLGPAIARQVQSAPGCRGTEMTRGRGLSHPILRPAFDFTAASPGLWDRERHFHVKGMHRM